MNRKTIFLAWMATAGVLLASLLACSYHEDKHPLTSGVGGPDSTPPEQKATFSFLSAHVIKPQCLGCHSPGGEAEDAPLMTYDDVMTEIKTGNLMKRVEKGNMPPNNRPKVSADMQQAMHDWMAKGAPND